MPRLVKKLRRGSGEQERSSKLYGVEHGVLHLRASPETWWMNMGYWKDQEQPVSLAKACEALLREVLTHAGLLSLSSSSSTPRSGSSQILLDGLCIVDVGFGCGDQTQAISNLSNDTISYIGITLDQEQYDFARYRGLESSSKGNARPDVKLFQADAARPENWTADLREAVRRQFHPTPPKRVREAGRHWLLGLDTLYHFHPSRRPLFAYAHKEMAASLMAFDLLLADQPLSWTQLLLMRISCALSSTPYTNFLTKSAYMQLLVSVGYREEDIQITDVSRHVFTPLSKFLEHHDRQLQVLGLSIGKFNAAKWLFRWWGSTGIVRGCIVIARR